MKTPAFWYRNSSLNWRAILLRPLGFLYAAATKRRVSRPAEFVANVPVICIGNINAGGTGKTPATIALLQYLSAWGLTPHVVTRGYGGKEPGPKRVDEKVDTADQVGDEPLLLAAFGPTWVSKDRAAGAKMAQDAGADILLMDDGFQNPQIQKDISIVVVDAYRGFGNGLCIPAGPLREPVSDGLKRADLLLSIGPDSAQEQFSTRWGASVHVPKMQAVLAPLQTGMDWQDTKVVAFAGIGHPEKFFSTLRQLGADIVSEHALDDHQPLTSSLLSRLEKDSTKLGAQLVSTEKDATRLPKSFRRKVVALPVRLEINDWAPLDRLIEGLAKKASN